MNKLAHISLMIIISLLLLIVMSLSLLLYSPNVNHWLIRQAETLIPGLSIAKVDGLLLNELQLDGVRYASDQLELNIKSLNYAFKASDLLDRQVLFESIQIDGVELLMADTETASETEHETVDFIMPVSLRFQDISLDNLHIKHQQQSYFVDHIDLALDYQGQQLQISQLALASDSGHLQGKVDVSINAQFAFQAELTLAKTMADVPPLKAQLSAHGDVHKIYLDARVQAPSEVNAHAWVKLDKHRPPQFDIQLAWAALQWPLQGTRQYASENAQLSLSGTTERYRVVLDSALFAQDIAAEHIHLVGLGDTQQLSLQQLQIKALKGELQSTGRFSWTETIPSDLQLWAKDIQLASLLPDYPGVFNLTAQVSGQLINKPDMQLTITQLQGMLMGHKVNGRANLHYQAEQTDIQQLQLKVGTNTLMATGQLGKHNALSFEVDATDLQQLSPDLSGALYADGNLQGTLSKPTVKLDVHSNGLGFQQQTIGQIRATARLDAEGEGQLDLEASVEHIKLEGVDINRFELQSAGSLMDHRVAAQVDSAQGHVDLELQGAWQPQQDWQGELQYLQLASATAGTWQLIKAAPLQVSFAKQQPLQVQTDMCLAQKSATGLLCVTARLDKYAGQQLEGSIQQLPLTIFAPWLPENVQLDSYLQAQFALATAHGIEGHMQLSLDPGAASVVHEDSGVQLIHFQTARVDADIAQDKLAAELVLVLDQQKRIDGQLQVTGWSDLDSAELDGALDVRMDNLAFVNAFSRSIDDIDGVIEARVQLQGLLASPTFNGTHINVSKGQLSIRDAGVSVRDIHFQASQQQRQHLALQGGAEIEGKPLRIKGQLDNYANDQLQFKFAIKGDNLALLQLPDMHAWVSPDLQLSGSRKGAQLTGNVVVPKATLLFASLPEGAVALSDDELIISDQQPAPKVAAYPFGMNINILLGDDVVIEGFGLKSHLQGELRAALQQGDFKLFNNLHLLKGTYQAYGQDLRIEKGQLLFAGDVDNTGVNLLASRKASDWDDKTIAYLSMSGMLKSPTTHVYTEPALSESESLAYLLTGSSMEGGGGSHAGLIAKAALGLGRDYVDAVMGTVGIDEFDIKSTAVGHNSMVLGKRIGPNLYARYIVDILSSQMQFAVEYKWNKNISIETRAGSTHSSDIKYNIEFD